VITGTSRWTNNSVTKEMAVPLEVKEGGLEGVSLEPIPPFKVEDPRSRAVNDALWLRYRYEKAKRTRTYNH